MLTYDTAVFDSIKTNFFLLTNKVHYPAPALFIPCAKSIRAIGKDSVEFTTAKYVSGA